MALASENSRGPVRFGRFTFDRSENRLFKNGRELAIQEQPAKLLGVLLENAGTVVTREELRTRLWPDKQFLEFDAALNTTVKKLRAVLKDDAAAPQFILTLPKKGYRFIGELSSEAKPDLRREKVVPISLELPDSINPALMQPDEAAGIESERWRASHPATFWVRHRRVAMVVGLALFAVAATLLFFSRPRTLPELVERQLTSNSSEQVIADSALSPDGKYLAYTNLRHVMVLSLTERVTHTLSNLDRLRAFHVSWTSDSARLLVTGYETPGATSSLWQVSILGNEDPQRTAENVYDARQSPDGNNLAVIRADRNELSILSSYTGEERRSYSGRRMFSPAWSPDSSRVWFLEDLEREGWRTLRSLSVQPNQPSGPAAKLRDVASILALPDSRMAYAREDGIYSLRAESATGRIYGEPLRRLKTASPLRLSASSDGKTMAYEKGDPGSDVFVGDLSNGNMRLSNTHRLTLDDAQDYPHAWTKDGRSVLFESDRSGSWTLYAQPFDAPDPKALTSSEASSVKPVATPDGNSLLYMGLPRHSGSGASSEAVKIMRMPISGGTPVELVSSGHLTGFHCPSETGRLCVMEEKIGAMLQYSYLDPVRGKMGAFRGAEQAPIEMDWDLSPDGSTVALLPRSGEDDHIWLFKGAEPKKEIQIVNAKQLRSLNWWADGKGFFMASFGDGGPLLMTAPLSGNAAVLSDEIRSVPSWGIPSPDGKRLAFVVYLESHKAWMVEGF
jgi:DNA-binding winged helix-turn-helix (wHTH) protein/Tol biopolymer transport system component